MIFLCPFLHCKALRTAMHKRYINSIIIIIIIIISLPLRHIYIFLQEVEWSNQKFVGPGLQRFIGWPRPWQLGNDEYITLCNFGDRSMTQLMFWLVQLALTLKMTTALLFEKSVTINNGPTGESLLTFSFCLISIGLSLSNETNKMKFLNIYWKSISILIITEKLSPI